jgi:hypothetical protein
VFLDHKGVLKHEDGEETGRKVEKILNDHTVKRNLQNILERTTKDVQKLRSQNVKTPEFSSSVRNTKRFSTQKGMLPPTLDFNDRTSSSGMMNSSATHSMFDNDAVSGFASTVKA